MVALRTTRVRLVCFCAGKVGKNHFDVNQLQVWSLHPRPLRIIPARRKYPRRKSKIEQPAQVKPQSTLHLFNFVFMTLTCLRLWLNAMPPFPACEPPLRDFYVQSGLKMIGPKGGSEGVDSTCKLLDSN